MEPLTPRFTRRAIVAGLSAVPLVSTGRSLARAPVDPSGEFVPIEGFVGPGESLAADCGPAILRAATAVGTGGRIGLLRRYRLASPVPNLSGITLVGTAGRPAMPMRGENPYERASLLVIAPSAFLPDTRGTPTSPAFPAFGAGSGLWNLSVLLEGLKLPWANAAAAREGLALYRGQVFGFTSATNDVDIADNFFGGFAQITDGYLGGGGRITITRNRFDCGGGFRVHGSLDTCRSQDNHGWPFLTASLASLDTDRDILHRSGIAFAWDGRADGSTSINDLAFGFGTNFSIRDCPGFRLIAPWSDHGNPLTADQVGIHFHGNCASAELHAAASVACHSTLVLDTGSNRNTYGNGTGAVPLGNPIRVFGGALNGAQYGADLVSGESVFDGTTFDAGQHVMIRAGIVAASFDNCVFTRGGGIATEDDATRARVKVAGTCRFVDGTPGFVDWFSYAPAVAAPTASGVSFESARGEYRRSEGGLVEVRMQVTVTDGGSGGGTVTIGLPFPSAGRFAQHLQGTRERVGGEGLKVTIDPGSTLASVHLLDGRTTALKTGTVIEIDGRYRAAP